MPNWQPIDGGDIMKEYSKPDLNIMSLESKENIANVIPTFPDRENVGVSIPNVWDTSWD